MKLEIEQLVVHGVSGDESERLVSVIESELRVMFAADGAIGAFGARGTLADVTVEIPQGLEVGELGSRVARTICESFRAQGVGGSGSEPARVMDSRTADSPPFGASGRVE